MEDYRLSNDYFNIPSASRYAYNLPARSQEAITTIYSAREDFLNAAKEEIERTYGDMDTYLQMAIGLSKEEIKKLQKNTVLWRKRKSHVKNYMAFVLQRAGREIRTHDPEITNHVLWPTELYRLVLSLRVQIYAIFPNLQAEKTVQCEIYLLFSVI